MAEYDDDFDFDTEDDGGNLVKQLRKQLKEMSAALKERDELLEEYFTATREEQIAESLSEMGLSAKIAKFVPDDVEDEDELIHWLSEYGDAFGVQAKDTSSTEGSDLDSEVIQAAERMSAIEEGGVDPTIGQGIEARIQSASTPEELAAILKG